MNFASVRIITDDVRLLDVLQYLEEHPKVSQKQAEAFKIDRTTMVSQIDYLEEIQCVQRVRNPKDRGFFALRVTKQAKEKLR
ncbi:hypothetical protein GCM10011391_31350 [Pullulanibacillus camelliae]|uniref:HTH marR-type domain-containing protein n=1 Tax=Pullulanibacillus camelliae TaxID=1707096 RepID=A0A8J2YL91_9BACL|nr:helix-turn-helix domain-containing protein [Pullulanibacillus camelliae]GGE50328.1 hypothetical protein GCM10011391_31350 [Pullulanibacillus camelliae]